MIQQALDAREQQQWCPTACVAIAGNNAVLKTCPTGLAVIFSRRVHCPRERGFATKCGKMPTEKL